MSPQPPKCSPELLELLESVGMKDSAEGLAASGFTSVERLKTATPDALAGAGVSRVIHQRKLRRAVTSLEVPQPAPEAGLPSPSVPTPPAKRGRRRVAGEDRQSTDASSRCGDRARYSEQHATCPDVVHTPWARDISLPQCIPLGAEVLRFGSFLRPTAEEKSASTVVKLAVQLAASRTSPGSRACIIGSRAFDCSLPSSGTDICVESWQGGAEVVQQLFAELAAAGYQASQPTRVPTGWIQSMRYTDRFGAPRESTLVLCEEPKSAQRRLSQMLRRRMDSDGGLIRSVCLVVRTLLAQSLLTGASRGALRGEAIGVMVTAVADSEEVQSAAADDAASTLLIRTLSLYGGWDWDSHSVGVGAPCVRKQHAAPASVLTPFDAAANLAEGCSKQRQVSAMLEYARLGIAKWESEGPLQPGQSMSGGVTPLSSVIAHKNLWDRSHMLRRVGQTAATHAAAPPPVRAGSYSSASSAATPSPQLVAAAAPHAEAAHTPPSPAVPPPGERRQAPQTQPICKSPLLLACEVPEDVGAWSECGDDDADRISAHIRWVTFP